ncbi:hypothetical protein ACP4OV_007488 [Aristida adscensionis]
MHRLTEDNITEILVRLPTRSVCHARAVCKVWCRITTTPRFLTAHARRQPVKFVLYSNLERGDGIDIALDALPISSFDDEEEASRQRLFRYPKGACRLLASCDGVLLLKKGSESNYLLCNLAMMQWAELPCLAFRAREYAFYFHQPSGEYRLLCHCTHKWYILSTGTTEPRRLNIAIIEIARLLLTKQIVPGISDLLVTTPASLHGHLHWLPRLGRVTDGMTSIVVFDTLLETFRGMAGPPTTTIQIKLLNVDEQLVAADFVKPEQMDLWFLEDYNAGRWELRHRIAIPQLYDPEHFASGVSAGYIEGNIILGSYNHSVIVYNMRRKTLKKICCKAMEASGVLVSRHVLRESLAQHPSFSARSSADLRLIHFWY